MPTESVRVSSVLPSSADRIYAAWLDGLEHSRMTGGKATVDARVGGRHTAWDDYIEGEILALEPGRRIAQSWRAADFPEGHAHSRLEIFLADVPGGCEVTLVHSEIPEGLGDQYEEGWSTHYFVPMKKHFGGPSRGGVQKAAAPGLRKAAKKPAKKAGKPKKASKTHAKKMAAKGTAKKAARPTKKARARKTTKKARSRRRS
jgi:uncharacterized protein YndB with AHSA1/START domain